jgi:hypothetical protein
MNLSSRIQAISASGPTQALHDTQASRDVEQAALAAL